MDRAGAEPVTDLLQLVGLVAGSEPVGQFDEPEPGFGGLAFGPFVAEMTTASFRPVCRAASYAAQG
jgi:hypothetical protein